MSAPCTNAWHKTPRQERQGRCTSCGVRADDRISLDGCPLFVIHDFMHITITRESDGATCSGVPTFDGAFTVSGTVIPFDDAWQWLLDPESQQAVRLKLAKMRLLDRQDEVRDRKGRRRR